MAMSSKAPLIKKQSKAKKQGDKMKHFDFSCIFGSKLLHLMQDKWLYMQLMWKLSLDINA